MPLPLCSTPKSYAALLTVLESCSEEELSMEYIYKKKKNYEYKRRIKISVMDLGPSKINKFCTWNFFFP